MSATVAVVKRHNSNTSHLKHIMSKHWANSTNVSLSNLPGLLTIAATYMTHIGEHKGTELPILHVRVHFQEISCGMFLDTLACRNVAPTQKSACDWLV